MSNIWYISKKYGSHLFNKKYGFHLFNILCHNSGLTLSGYFAFTNTILVTETRRVGHCARCEEYFSNCVITIDGSITINLAMEKILG
jgi:hypothetical protein